MSFRARATVLFGWLYVGFITMMLVAGASLVRAVASITCSFLAAGALLAAAKWVADGEP